MTAIDAGRPLPLLRRLDWAPWESFANSVESLARCCENEAMVHHPEGPFQASRFDHRQHVRFAWSVLTEVPGPVGASIVADEIRDFAAVRAPGRYHETITQFWLRLVEHTIQHAREADEFDQLLIDFPILTDATAPLHHWSREALWSAHARTEFLAPDLVPLP